MSEFEMETAISSTRDPESDEGKESTEEKLTVDISDPEGEGHQHKETVKLDLGFISSDEFLVKDIQGEGFRHIVFATRYQLELLSETKIWYMDDIPAAFETLKERANTEPLQSLVNYFDRQWIHHAIFRPSSWTVYQQSVRTNNDVEGWHHRVNGKAGHRSCTFYKLVPLLLQEAKLVETRVSSDNLLRNVRHSSNATQKKLDTAWEQYDAGDISTGHFLRLCGSLYAPCE